MGGMVKRMVGLSNVGVVDGVEKRWSRRILNWKNSEKRNADMATWWDSGMVKQRKVEMLK